MASWVFPEDPGEMKKLKTKKEARPLLSKNGFRK
jgi:hypothetical protein